MAPASSRVSARSTRAEVQIARACFCGRSLVPWLVWFMRMEGSEMVRSAGAACRSVVQDAFCVGHRVSIHVDVMDEGAAVGMYALILCLHVCVCVSLKAERQGEWRSLQDCVCSFFSSIMHILRRRRRRLSLVEGDIRASL